MSSMVSSVVEAYLAAPLAACEQHIRAREGRMQLALRERLRRPPAVAWPHQRRC